MPDAGTTGLGESPDALEMLRDDHKRILELLKQFRETSTPENKKGIADNVAAELSTHSLLEEEFIHPVLRRLGRDETAVDRVERGHGETEHLTEQIAETDTSDPQFDALVGQLAERVSAHVDEEERLFDQLNGLGDEERVAMGQKMLQRREDALRELQENVPAASANPGKPN